MSTSRPIAGRDHEPGLEDLGRVETGWTLFLGVGALTILLGLGLVAGSFLVGDSSALVFGWIMIVAALIEAAGSYFSRRWIGSVAAVMNGVLYGFIGLTLFAEHTDVAGGVIYAVAGLVFAAGLFRMVVGASNAYTHREITLFNGALGMLIGLMVGAAGYAELVWAVGVLLGIEVIVTGVAWVLFGVVLRELRKDERIEVGAG